MVESKTVLVTGASRGVGAETARILGARGNQVVINYREKQSRAEKLVSEIRAAGGHALAVGADLTVPGEVAGLVDEIAARYGHLDAVVLNASGGLERGSLAGYAYEINRDAQVRVLGACRRLLRAGSTVVYVTSHQAHFVETRAAPADYLPVAESKRAGENAIRALQPELHRNGIGLSVVSGDMIDGTIIVRLLERRDPEAVETRRKDGPLPSLTDFATAVADEAQREGIVARTVFVGGSDYLAS